MEHFEARVLECFTELFPLSYGQRKINDVVIAGEWILPLGDGEVLRTHHKDATDLTSQAIAAVRLSLLLRPCFGPFHIYSTLQDFPRSAIGNL
jgi:hypothetical protein